MTFDLDRIEALAAVLDKAPHVVEVELGEGESRLVLRRGEAVAGAAVPTPVASVELAPTAVLEPEAVFLRASVVGTFHPRKGQPVQVGDVVRQGDIVGRIDTMRIPNDCVSPMDGVVAEVLVPDGAPVEYGQPLFEIGPGR
ncbi:MAG: acetyl-CoA carboxylase biotin carboxyl carrier protein [Armatimonadota bacterium]